MGELFTDNKKSILFDIDKYQYHIPHPTDQEYSDANWLTVNINYTEMGLNKNFVDSCILTFELEELVQQIDDIIDGKETGMISDFLEPFLRFAVIKLENIYAVQIRFVYDTTDDWKEIYISQGMNENEFLRMRDGLDMLRKKFPIRRIPHKN